MEQTQKVKDNSEWAKLHSLHEKDNIEYVKGYKTAKNEGKE